MKRGFAFGLLTLALLSCAVLGGCRKQAAQTGSVTPVQGDGKTLRLFIWSEYIDPQVVKNFEKQFGARVITDTYESNESMLAKLAGGGSNYDLAVPSNYAVPGMIRAGLLRKLDKTLLPNLKNMGNLFPRLDYDPGGVYSVPYQFAATGLAYRRDRSTPDPRAWSLIFGPSDTLSFVLLDDPREVIGAALKYLGHSVNTSSVAELRSARDLLRRVVAKRGFRGFDGGPGTRNQLLAGSVDYGQIYVGDLLIATEENPNVQVFLPREGTTISLDTLVVLKSSRNAELAHRFIDYVLQPKVGAAISNFTYYSTPNLAAKPYLSELLKNTPALNPPPKDFQNGKLEFIGELQGNRTRRIYDRIWTELKSR
ncbi:spermidine/putrescine ABC transporter substrate-binding protein [Deinococcus sp.]|uniref:polyamine ABC transporter substrate-binding protein n=1 Tax=Deinococcus sp. TaxID=47478 RepID=UPI0025D35A2D|nr:spermidine/putrescine ABC transporter substrate-binding protein [Deinococcus sp.]